MKGTSLIGHIIELYALTQRNHRAPDVIANEFFRSHRYLGSHDRRFIAEAVYGMIRYQLRLSRILQDVLEKIDGGASIQSRALLTYVTYLISVRQEDLASIADELQSIWNVMYPNRSLYDLLETIEQRANATQIGQSLASQLAERYSFPEWFVESLIQQHGAEWTEAFLDASNESAPVTIRVNVNRFRIDEVQAKLLAYGITSKRTRYSPFGLTLEKRVNLESLPLFKEGAFEPQDEGSQLVLLLASPLPQAQVLDACAGTGGKTLGLLALMTAGGTIVATDVSQDRLRVLKRRLARAQVSQSQCVRVSDVNEVDGMFDVVFIDAPCSGLGTVRRNPWLKNVVTEETVRAFHRRQLSILNERAGNVKHGGRLVYVTCTVTHDENESVIEEFLSSHLEFRIVPAGDVLDDFGLRSLAGDQFLRLYPHVHSTDGFFGAVLERNEC
ncbi:MAG: RsmB/NOP family class I SAM-dependent RNA methyltransferase [Bacteroidota bacterium]